MSWLEEANGASDTLRIATLLWRVWNSSANARVRPILIHCSTYHTFQTDDSGISPVQRHLLLSFWDALPLRGEASGRGRVWRSGARSRARGLHRHPLRPLSGQHFVPAYHEPTDKRPTRRHMQPLTARVAETDEMTQMQKPDAI